MIRPGALAAALAVALALSAASALACPAPSPELLFHSCWGEGRARVLLLPEDSLPDPVTAAEHLLVTGAYTATDTRDGGLAKPVGLFVHGGRVINPNLARMDGVLVVDPAGTLSLHHRAAVPLGGHSHDLRTLAERQAFAAAASAAGLSVLQSHLLIGDGRLDVRPVPDAPRAVRRMLFTDADGYGIWQPPGLLTLHEAAEALVAAHAPRMALNLDMGGHDYCWRHGPEGARSCGLLGRDETATLSNLIGLEIRPRDAAPG